MAGAQIISSLTILYDVFEYRVAVISGFRQCGVCIGAKQNLVGTVDATRKIAARVRAAVTACGTGFKFSVTTCGVIGSVSRQSRIE
jgi:hypothetical protein